MAFENSRLLKVSTLTDISDSIRNILGTSDLIPPANVPKLMTDVYSKGFADGQLEAGGDAEYGQGFSDGYAEGFTAGEAAAVKFDDVVSSPRIHSLNDFQRENVELIFPKLRDMNSFLTISGNDDATRARANKTVKSLSITGGEEQVTSMYRAFNCSNITVDSTLVHLTFNFSLADNGNYYSAFNMLKALEIIDGTSLNMTGTTNTTDMFRGCYALREVLFSGVLSVSLDLRHSPLSRSSIESVVSILSVDATGHTLTLKQSAVDTAFETTEGAADGSSSEEWTELVAEKPNWTISLV